MQTIPSTSRHIIWLIGVSFVLFQFFLQLSSGVVIGSIMMDMHFSAFTAGLLSSVFYVTYAGLQIPVGILFDRKNTRSLLFWNTLLCSCGCFLFAGSYGLFGLFAGRLLIGCGSAFAFIGLSHLLRRYYASKHFAFMIGLSETLGFLVTVIGIIVLGAWVSQWGWRGFINGAGVLGLVIAYLCWRFIPNNKPEHLSSNHLQQLLQILSSGKAWINGIFVGLSFTIVASFGALWAVPFIQVKLSCNLQQASVVSALFFLGTAVGCPLFGWLSAHYQRRRPLILSSSLSTTILLVVILFLPTQSFIFLGLLMFLLGLCCGAYMLAYTIANELAPPGSLSTCTGFTNTLAVITTPLLQPLIGYLLDTLHQTDTYTIIDYQYALLTIPVSLFLASILVFFLPEKAQEHNDLSNIAIQAL